MLLSHRRDPTIQLQVADSVRYREAVSRLKRILYNRPSSYERSVSPFSWKEKRYFPEEQQRTKEEFEKEIPDKNQSWFQPLKPRNRIALHHESFRKALTPDLSALTDADEKADEVINCLERREIVECINCKKKQFLIYVEEKQKQSTKFFNNNFHKSQERERAGERLLMDREKNLSRLEEDSRDKITKTKSKILKDVLKKPEEANERLEKVLQEQRNTSEATFKRLEALLDRRNLETESFTKRRKSLEKQVTDLKQENQRLLQAINDLAKVERTSNTDDVQVRNSSLQFISQSPEFNCLFTRRSFCRPTRNDEGNRRLKK
ncbi:hypothetical protein Avbf_15053, partial [Armadillidium vulgare]